MKSPYVGQVTHYFSKISVVVIKIEKSNLMVGDKINIKGQVTDLIQVVKSLQIESVDVKSAKVGQLVGLKVLKSAQVGDKVYKLS
ncbi:MAG: translation elongation factor-like protein [Candidatus Omnitrophica bacterium]|nr:translation elongation factor-like protein [Candidatus Omnitrophota bacterium]